MPDIHSLLGRPLRLAMIGGGAGSMIGPVHRRAAGLAGRFDVVAAALSSDAGRSAEEAGRLGIPRAYPTGEALVAGEAARDDGADVVAVLTPDDSHVRFSASALSAGLDVFCEKPLATDLASALHLGRVASESGRLLGLVHNYTGFALVREARAMIAAGEIGRVQLVTASFLMGTLGRRVEDAPERMPARLRWRLDPERGGPSHALADIGSHLHHLVTYVTGLPAVGVLADLGAAVAERSAHDTAAVAFRLANGARGTLLASKAATGAAGRVRLEVYGDAGGLAWDLAEPERLDIVRPGQPRETRRPGCDELHPLARRAVRGCGDRAGSDDAFLEAFANLYLDFGDLVAARISGTAPDPLAAQGPALADGIAGLRFIDACLASSRSGGWVECSG